METPRRRSQNREPKAEETPAAGTASDIRSAENCVNTVRDLQDELKNAKKTLDRGCEKYYYYTARKQKLPLLTLVAMRGRVNKSVFQETGVR